MPEAVRKYHERRDSADRVPVAGDSPEDYMSPIVRPLPSVPLILVVGLGTGGSTHAQQYSIAVVHFETSCRNPG